MAWHFFIDRGGTFTDCVGANPSTGEMRAIKVLSSDRAPVEGIRQLLGLSGNAPIPRSAVRLGTTVATNAVLERRGTPVGLVISRGFGDLLEIGDQTRPELFALNIEDRATLTSCVVEVDARLAATGEVLATPSDLTAAIESLRSGGAESVAVAVIHSYVDGDLERSIADAVREAGFSYVQASAELTATQGLLARTQTTVLDAYLTPSIRRAVAVLEAEVPQSQVKVMQSSGGLTTSSRLRGQSMLLSGPAGGVLASSWVARQAGFASAIGFDMGGTSTDVCCVENGEPDRVQELEIAGMIARAPALDIHTVAAGGGSLCRYDGFRFTVGPSSAGADPGPLCYGKHQAGNRDRCEGLALTDVNLALGRIVQDRFPFPLDPAPVAKALAELSERAHHHDAAMSPDAVAWGFLQIANANMAEAVRSMTIARGRDPRGFALVVYGGAGGQHACAVARLLGIRTILCHPRAGVLSALGLGLASSTWHGETDGGRLEWTCAVIPKLEPSFVTLERGGREILGSEGDDVATTGLTSKRSVRLRYRGTDCEIDCPVDDGAYENARAGASDSPGDTSRDDRVRAYFEDQHRRLFGYLRPGHPIEICTLVVDLIAPRGTSPLDTPTSAHGASAPPAGQTPPPLRLHRIFTEDGWTDCGVYCGDTLTEGAVIVGPALIADDTQTTVVDPLWRAEMIGGGVMKLTDQARPLGASSVAAVGPDPVRIELYGNRFMSIARQMGAVLERTALSTNIRERRDYSCAVFDPQGGLVANAPHIPVHLGAMGESVRAVLKAHPNPPPGTAFVTNDPSTGGSHLPDITCVLPVHDSTGQLLFVTASRGHHADIGGITPGSMPPFASSLDQEGIVLRALPILDHGTFDRHALERALTAGPHPARRPAENIADLTAQLAACQTGAHLLRALCAQAGQAETIAYLGHVQDNAAAEVASEIARMPDGVQAFGDQLDDGTVIAVTIRKHGAKMEIDFSGSGAELRDKNLNAPRAVTIACVLYVLRCLVRKQIPLNSGCLRPVSLIIPPRSVLDPSPGLAVAGGNVETSQRVVDVLLGALGLAAASQGTMNNLTFGDSHFGYYETIGGGAGGTPIQAGASAIHTHMTNTRITDPEVLESRHPVRLLEFSRRRGSGGTGAHPGGDGIVREFEFLAPLEVSLVAERRLCPPFGLGGGGSGRPGRDTLDGSPIAGHSQFQVVPGSRLRIETPGGGGVGQVHEPSFSTDNLGGGGDNP